MDLHRKLKIRERFVVPSQLKIDNSPNMLIALKISDMKL